LWSGEADRHPSRDAPADALLTVASVVLAVVDLGQCPGSTLVLQELVHDALAGLPDADGFVVPDLAVAHHLDDQLQDVLLCPLDDHLDHLGRELGQVARQLARPDERTMHVLPDVPGQVARLVPKPEDVVVGPTLGATVRSELVAGVLLCGVVELTDQSSLRSGCQVLDLVFVEQVGEVETETVDLAVLLSCGHPVGLGPTCF
jgi:hypothetical protein